MSAWAILSGEDALGQVQQPSATFWRNAWRLFSLCVWNAPGRRFRLPCESARGLAHSRRCRAFGLATNLAKRPGVRQPSGAFAVDSFRTRQSVSSVRRRKRRAPANEVKMDPSPRRTWRALAPFHGVVPYNVELNLAIKEHSIPFSRPLRFFAAIPSTTLHLSPFRRLLRGLLRH